MIVNILDDSECIYSTCNISLNQNWFTCVQEKFILNWYVHAGGFDGIGPNDIAWSFVGKSG